MRREKRENTLQRGFTKCGAVVGSPKPNTERDNLYSERGAFNLSSAETKKVKAHCNPSRCLAPVLSFHCKHGVTHFKREKKKTRCESCTFAVKLKPTETIEIEHVLRNVLQALQFALYAPTLSHFDSFS